MAEGKTTIYITGMTCSHCEKTVSNKIKNTTGVTDATINLEKGTADVMFDTNIISADKIIEAINSTEIYTAHA